MNSDQRLEIDLRLWEEGDLPILQRLMGDPVMTEHLGPPETPDQILARHARYCEASRTGQDMMLVITAGPDRLPAGSIGYWQREWQGGTVWETGWSVLPEFQGQGIASRAARLVIERARAEGTHRFLHAFPSVDNHASNRICRKAGFSLLGEVDFEYPRGHWMRCRDWQYDLFPTST